MRALALVVALAWTGLPLWAEPSREAAFTLVIYNEKVPSSKMLADYYAKARGIPADQVVGLACSEEEEIGRKDYDATIAKPLRRLFDERKWWTLERGPTRPVVTSSRIRFAVLMRGMPLKIRQRAAEPEATPPPIPEDLSPIERNFAQFDYASVDSELAGWFALPEDPRGLLANPYFRRFERALNVPPGAAPLMVCRLDAPREVDVLKMIDDSLEAERDGLWGWAYVDSRHIASGEYAEGDRWMRGVAILMRRQGIPVITDDAPEVLDAGFPVTDAAVYYGWYSQTLTGPFAREDVRFVRGAVAAHLYSFSASSLRDPRGWTAAMITRGAAATFGNVYEPYLGLTVNFEVVQDRLMNGFTLAEAGYAGYRALSWMGVIVGDPLYRPYARWTSLDDGDANSIWVQYRRAVQSAGGVVEAAESLRRLAKDTGNSLPLEALAQAQAAGDDLDGALATLEEAMALQPTGPIHFRLVLERIEMLRRFDRNDLARARLAEALGDVRSEEERATLGRLALILQPPAAPSPSGTPR